MDSFIKFICDNQVPYNPDWLNDPDQMYRSLPVQGKIHFIMGQAVMLNYLERVYNTGLPSLIIEYKNKVSKWWMIDLESGINLLDDVTDEQRTAINNGYQAIQFLLGLNPSVQFSFEDTMPWLEHLAGVPTAGQNTFYSPYLRFIERARRSANLAEGDHAQSTESFSLPGPVTLPSFSYRGTLLVASFETSFSSYKYDYTSNHKFGTGPFSLGVESIFSYWRGYNWSGVSFNGVVGVLATQCLELDSNTFPNNSLLWAYYDVYCKVLQWSPKGTGESNFHWLSSESRFLRRCVLNFLIDLRDRYNIAFDDSELLAKLIGNVVEDADKLHAFLTVSKPSEVSVEMYSAFRKSEFVRFDELDLMKHTRLSSRELIEATIDAKSSDKDLSDTQQDDSTSGKKSNRRRRSAGGPTKEGELSDNSFSQLDEQTEVDDDEAQPDGEDENATAGDDSNTDQLSDNSFDELDDSNPEADTTPDDEPNDPNDPDSQPGNDTQNTHTQSLPDSQLLDDKRGVKLELSVGETTNSVLYRIELEAYIDSLLANPPSFLSVQKVEILKRIKAYWFNLLSVTSLVDCIKAVIKLPKQLNLKLTSS